MGYRHSGSSLNLYIGIFSRRNSHRTSLLPLPLVWSLKASMKICLGILQPMSRRLHLDLHIRMMLDVETTRSTSTTHFRCPLFEAWVVFSTLGSCLNAHVQFYSLLGSALLTHWLHGLAPIAFLASVKSKNTIHWVNLSSECSDANFGLLVDMVFGWYSVCQTLLIQLHVAINNLESPIILLLTPTSVPPYDHWTVH